MHTKQLSKNTYAQYNSDFSGEITLSEQVEGRPGNSFCVTIDEVLALAAEYVRDQKQTKLDEASATEVIEPVYRVEIFRDGCHDYTLSYVPERKLEEGLTVVTGAPFHLRRPRR